MGTEAPRLANGGTNDHRVALIGGTSLLESKLFASLTAETVHTEFGNAILHVGEVTTADDARLDIVFVQRHHADADKGATVYNSPHILNQKAYLSALKQKGMTTVLSICSVGSLHESIRVGSIVVPDDFFFLTSVTFYDDARGHVVPSLSRPLREDILSAIASGAPFENVPLVDRGTYVQTVGPRFETRAEVRHLCTLGDVVGMTAASEAVLAQELGMSYAMLCMVDNYANGVQPESLTPEEFRLGVRSNQRIVEQSVRRVFAFMARQRAESSAERVALPSR